MTKAEDRAMREESMRRYRDRKAAEILEAGGSYKEARLVQLGVESRRPKATPTRLTPEALAKRKPMNMARLAKEPKYMNKRYGVLWAQYHRMRRRLGAQEASRRMHEWWIRGRHQGERHPALEF
jgi:hypothetical protein